MVLTASHQAFKFIKPLNLPWYVVLEILSFCDIVIQKALLEKFHSSSVICPTASLEFLNCS